MGSLIISEGIILIASIIIAAGFSVTVLNQMGVFKSTLASAGAAEKEIALTRIKILYATNSSSTQVDVWVKNIGTNQIVSLNKMDVYLGKLNSVQGIPYNAASPPKWTYTNSNGNVWQQKDTIKITVTLNNSLETNSNYMVRIATPNGISDDYIFSISTT
jgi:flagellar protein FlaG